MSKSIELIMQTVTDLQAAAGNLAIHYADLLNWETVYKVKYAEAMISPSNDGKNKEQREAFAEVRSGEILKELNVCKGKYERAKLEYEALRATNATHRAILLSGVPKQDED